jgi:hypothetical protein
MSNLGREMPSSSLNSAGDHDDSQGWHRRAVMHNRLTAVVCSAEPITQLEKVDLAGLTPADLLSCA